MDKSKEIAVRNYSLGYVTASLNLPRFSIASVEEMVAALQEMLEIDRSTAVWYGNQALLLAEKDQLCVSPTTPYELRYKKADPVTIHFLVSEEKAHFSGIV